MAEPGTGVLMFIAARHLEMRVLERLLAVGFDDLTVAQGRIAARISPQGTRVTELAEAAQVTKQSAAFLVDQLERSGYVTRQPDPADGRARLVCLTERGLAAQREGRIVERHVEDEWSRHLGAERLAELRSMMLELREITDPWRDVATG